LIRQNLYPHAVESIVSQSSIHPSIHPRARRGARVSSSETRVHHGIIIVVASSRRRVVASSSSSRRRRIAPKSAPAPPWRITIRSNKTSQNDARRRVAQWRPRVASPMCADGAPIDAVARSRVRECATRRDAVVEYDTMTTPMEMFHAMQAKLRESSREYETIAEGARR